MNDSLIDRVGRVIDEAMMDTAGDPPQIRAIREFKRWVEMKALQEKENLEGHQYMTTGFSPDSKGQRILDDLRLRWMTLDRLKEELRSMLKEVTND